MKNKVSLFSIFLFVLIFISIFYKWFFQSEIIGGDWPYLFKESLSRYSFFVSAWNTWQGNGLGGTNPIYFLQSFEYLTVFIATLFHISWPVVYKIFWFGLFIVLSIFSSFYLINTIFKKLVLWQKLLAVTIFTTNTYILMLVDGGQMGVALSYAVAPLVLARFMKLIDYLTVSNKNFQFPLLGGQAIFNFKLALLAGLALSLQVVFDPRLAYITIIAVAIYTLFKIKKNILNVLFLIFYIFIIPSLVVLLLHIFWILPFLIFSQNICERFCDAYTGVGIVKFLSFSTFSQSLSLLHPNWPENIFGKVGFMRPEFLAIPIFAYMSLLFVNNNKVKILFFALLGIVGAFLAKGANPPFGEVYLWLYENVPGFMLFRDPTKFYLLVALSYSILIPYGLWKISEKVLSIKNKTLSKSYVYFLVPFSFLIFWSVSIHPAILGQLGGTFKKHEVPKEYVELKDFLYKQPEFFRTLWVPSQHRFVFVSKIHPAVEAGALFNATISAEIIENLKKPESQEYLSSLAIKYVLVPYDNLGTIFQKDRKYDQEQYLSVVRGLESIPWLKKIDEFGKIQVFEIPSVKDHFWLTGNGGNISYKMLSPTHYLLNVSLPSSQKLIFSEKYNPSWAVKIDNEIIKSQRTSNNLNSFELKKGDYNLEIIFLQDKLYNYGRTISLFTLLTIMIFLFRCRNRTVDQ